MNNTRLVSSKIHCLKKVKTSFIVCVYVCTYCHADVHQDIPLNFKKEKPYICSCKCAYKIMNLVPSILDKGSCLPNAM